MTTKASINGAGTEKSLVFQQPIDNHYLDSIKIVSGVLGGLFAAALIITLIFYLLRYYKTASKSSRLLKFCLIQEAF